MGYPLFTTTTLLNPLSNLNNYGYAYGGSGFGAGGYRDDDLLYGKWDFVYEYDAHHGNHFIHDGSILRDYWHNHNHGERCFSRREHVGGDWSWMGRKGVKCGA